MGYKGELLIVKLCVPKVFLHDSIMDLMTSKNFLTDSIYCMILLVSSIIKTLLLINLSVVSSQSSPSSKEAQHIQNCNPLPVKVNMF